jgi:hypothetical protein
LKNTLLSLAGKMHSTPDALERMYFSNRVTGSFDLR